MSSASGSTPKSRNVTLYGREQRGISRHRSATVLFLRRCRLSLIVNINIKIIATVILASVNATTQECHGTFYEMVGVVIVIVSR